LLIQQVLKFRSKISRIQKTEVPSWELVDEIRARADRREARRRKSLQEMPPTFHVLSEAEYITLKDRCNEWLQRAVLAPESEQRAIVGGFMSHLIVLTLVSIPPPRAQVFSLMELECNLKWRSDLRSYEISFNGYSPPLKNEKPIYLVLPETLGTLYQTWVNVFRPYFASESCSFVFPNAKGKGKLRKITPFVTRVTQEYLGKDVPASKFR
jgi:hypothetical protein